MNLNTLPLRDVLFPSTILTSVFLGSLTINTITFCWRISGPQAYERRLSTDTRTEPMHWVLSPLALSLRIELTSPTDRKHIYKDCIASLKRFLKLSLHYSIVNITESHLDSLLRPVYSWTPDQDFFINTITLTNTMESIEEQWDPPSPSNIISKSWMNIIDAKNAVKI